MADFDLTQTDQQVQNILNDAQGAMGASAQTTLTTEYVMLKDTNGVYHKILKSSFTEAIRDVLAGLLVNNDKGTTINQIAAIASGDFGSITPANLASVLGVPLTFLYTGLAAGASVNFTVNQPRYLLVWLCESSGRGEMKLSLVIDTGETIVGASPSSSAADKFALSLDRTNNALILTNNDSVTIGGKIVVLANF